jgi:hypothetical protein
MINRYAQALFISEGACNPIAIANQIVESIKEVREEPDFKGTASINEDPAIRLMVHQLAYITGMNDGAWSDNYNAAFLVCREKSNAGIVRTKVATHVLGKVMTGADASDSAWRDSK